MMRSLYSGVSGLKTHQTKMDVIGNNIANVNTVAFKSSSVTFGELMYQTTSNASSPNADTGRGGVNAKQIGLGVQMGATNVSITTTGATQTTGNPFDLKITGDSFFIVNDGQSNFFTRAGAFYVDAVGNLAMTSTGYNVMGWQVGQDGNIIQNTVSPIKILSADHMFSQPEATTLGTCSGVLDKADPNLTSPNGKVLSLSVYDDLGYEYTAKFSIKPYESATTTTKQVTHTTTTYTTLPKIRETSNTKYTFRIKANDEDQVGNEITKYTTPGKLYDALKKYAETNTIGEGGIIELNTATLNTLAGAGYMDLGTGTTPTAEQFKTDPDIVGKKILVSKQDILGYSVDDGGTLTPLEGIEKETMEAFVKDAGPGVYKITNVAASGTTPAYRVFEPESSVHLIRTETRTYDGEAPKVTYYMVDNTSGAKTSMNDKLAEKKISSAQIGLLLGASKDSDVAIYDANEPDTVTQFIPGQYKIELFELVDIANNKTAVNLDALGETEQVLMYDTNNGKFRYVGDEGNNDYQLKLSALGGKFRDIAIDFSSTQNVSNEGTSTIGMKAGDEDGNGAGKLLGALKGVQVDSDGKIYGSYDNGNTELLGQIAVTEFANASGLEKVGENLYQTTLNSGEFDGIGRDISSLSGSMTTGVLEMSNVDLSAEFTDMITTQRGFQANSRIITTSDTLLEELINLKR